MTGIKKKIYPLLFSSVGIKPLALFRFVFGAVLLFSTLRFLYYGWVETLYVQPTFFFKYLGFSWVKPLSHASMSVIFWSMAMSAIGIMLGYFYRYASILFFVLFTYVELLDQTNYLNHYYFVSLVCFLLIFLPAHRNYSLDALLKRVEAVATVPKWTILTLQIQLACVYFFAGISKINTDWLLEALPMRIWLPAKAHLPIIGNLFDHVWVAYLFSWFGMLYDSSIPFLLWKESTRKWAYIAVIIFHIATWILFPIGVFPFVMIGATLIFFPTKSIKDIYLPFNVTSKTTSNNQTLKAKFMVLFLGFQLLIPLRFLCYPNHLFWTEQGYRFSWRVMLIEKAGYITFIIKDRDGHLIQEVNNQKYLSPNQIKMMSTQPDMILQFAHYLEEHFEQKLQQEIRIYAQSYVTLNGKGSKPFIDPTIDLTTKKRGFKHKKWVLPYPY